MKKLSRVALSLVLASSVLATGTIQASANSGNVDIRSNLSFSEAIAINGIYASKTKQEAIDKYIYGLNYEKNRVLAQDGEKISNLPRSTSEVKNGTFTVVKREKKTLSNNSSDIAVMDSRSSAIYPGALLLANKGLLDNNPTEVVLPRRSLTLGINLPGFNNNDNHLEVKNPTNSSVNAAVNSLVGKWHDTYGTKFKNTPANFEYSYAMAYSLSQLKTKFGASFEKLKVPLNIDFNAIHKGEKQVQIVNFRQIFYTVNVDAPVRPSQFIAPGVSEQELKIKGVTNQAPPVYVSSVAYGRSIFVKLETDSKSTEVQAAFKALIEGADISNNTEYQKILKNTKVSAVVVGGDAGDAAKIVDGKIEDLKNNIKNGARFSTKSPALPIAYTTRFLKDNSPAVVTRNSEYVETTSTSYTSSQLKLVHKGWFVARFYVNWEEVNYNEKGEEVVTKKEWEGNGWSRTAHWEQNIQLPPNARNVSVKAVEQTGLAWEGWRTVYDQKNLPLAGERTLSIWGTTLYPQYSMDVK